MRHFCIFIQEIIRKVIPEPIKTAVLATTLMLSLPLMAGAGEFVAFSKDYQRVRGRPLVLRTAFALPDASIPYRLVVYNGGENGQFRRISSGIILLNRHWVVGPWQLRKKTPVIEKWITPKENNVLAVILFGRPKAGITVQIVGIDDVPPVVTAPGDIVVNSVDHTGAPATNPDIAAFLDGASAVDNVDGPLPAPADSPPTIFPPGLTTVTFKATDSAGNTGTAQATVRVINNAPVVDAGPDLEVTLPDHAELKGTVTDDGLPLGGTLQIAWKKVKGPGNVSFSSPTTAMTTASFSAAGAYTLRLSADDGDISSNDDVEVMVAGQESPVSISSPIEGTRIGAPVEILGTVDIGSLDSWILEFRPQHESSYRFIASGNTTMNNESLGVFDPTLQLNGLTRLRLRAVDTHGQTTTFYRTVILVGKWKPGRFTISYNEATIPTPGLSTEVIRTYDSRDHRAGDFGVGWTLDLTNVRVQENRVMGTDWTLVDAGGSIHCVEPTDLHIVTVTHSDGTVHEFEPALDPPCHPSSSPLIATIRFLHRPGTNATLVPLGGVEVSAPNIPGPVELVDTSTGLPYDADRYRLTLRGGREMVLDQSSGLESIADVNGNSLTATPGGIFHSVGRSVIFTRDLMNRITQVTDLEGNTTSYVYDANGDLVAVTDPLGSTTTYSYDTAHRLLSITDPRGSTTTNGYNADGRLASNTDALGNTTVHTFDLGPHRETITGPLGQVTVHEVDVNGNAVRTTDPMGGLTARTYDSLGNLLSQTDPLGNVRTFAYDALGDLITETDPLGNVTLYTYNTWGRPLIVIDPLGRQTSRDYDTLGRLLRTTFPDGTTESFKYDSLGRIIARTDGAGHTTQFVYGDLSLPVATTFPDGATTTTTYDLLGRVIQRNDARGNNTTYGYDAGARRTSIVDAMGHTTQFEYDEVDNLIAITDGNGNRGRFDYDAVNRIVRILHPDGNQEIRFYDALGRTVGKTDPAGSTTLFEYDSLGRLVKVTGALGGETHYTYDLVGNRLSQIDANGNTTLFEYDALGRRVRRTLPLGRFETFSYDAVGNRVGKTDFNGNTTTFIYDLMDRLLSKTPDSGGPPITFTYTATGQRKTMVDASGKTTYESDARHRLLLKETPQGTLSYSYDEVGNLLSIRSSNLNGTSVDYAYDALNRLMAVTDYRLSPGSTGYAYDAVGNLIISSYPNGVHHSFTYDAVDRLFSLVINRPSGVLTSYDYTYGPAGNRLSAIELGGRMVAYDYDGLHRLVQESIAGDPSGSGSVSYTYDPVGNRLSRTSTLALVPSSTHAYDANDRLTSETYDDNGNTIGSGGKTFSYDFENHLTSMNSGAVTFVYDGDGNKVAKTVGGVTTFYLVDDVNPSGAAVVLETVEAGAVGNRYTYGLGLISRAGNTTARFYLHDGQGNIRFLTDGSAVMTDKYSYDAFGITIDETSTSSNDFLFAGAQLDDDLGFYHLKPRYYSPQLGRFVTPRTTSGTVLDPLTLHLYNSVGSLGPLGIDRLVDIKKYGLAIRLWP